MWDKKTMVRAGSHSMSAVAGVQQQEGFGKKSKKLRQSWESKKH